MDEKKSETAKREEEILAYWTKNQVFEQSLTKTSPKGEFVFYDGPPFATGLPHYGSLLSSIVKDVIPRYKTMRGYHVRRRWGWDCHGLPIENMVEKELGLKTKKDIETLGIEKFNDACRASVLRFADEWKVFIDRVARWVEFDNSYKTMDATYMESVWWALSQMHKKELLYEGRKVLLYCPHCETPLAKAEIAMDNSYKDVSEEAVTVKFKVTDPSSAGFPENTFLLAWTTTPWTLPGNVALAVSSDIRYVLVEDDGANYILAEDLVPSHFEQKEISDSFSAKKILGLSYEPLYEIEKVKNSEEMAWYVTDADFVTAEEGTGIVHTAVIYGEDDYALGVEKNLPMVPLLDNGGRFNTFAPKELQGMYFKDAETNIKDDLERRSLLFKKNVHTHSYPFCYRCGTALYYNAITSWFVNIQDVKKKLVQNNEKVSWYPEHLKEGRFLHTLESAPDWTISRNRYWASGLPIWKCRSCDKMTVIGSVDELKEKGVSSGNTLLLMRHGEAEGNPIGKVSSKPDPTNTLTERGQGEVLKTAQDLKNRGVDLIIVSPLTRTQQTATIVAKELGLSEDAVVTDDRLIEIDAGVFEGRTWMEYHAHFDHLSDQFTSAPEGGETRMDVKRRAGLFLSDLEEKYSNKTILIVSHATVLKSLAMAAKGASFSDSVAIESGKDYATAEVRELSYVPLPRNRDFEIDLHRPYIDEIKLTCECGGTSSRIPEVVDCWVESGSMPFSEYHYPFENMNEFESRFPSDFITEYIAQTRTWFYYMHAVAGILFGEPSFRQVLTTGTVLAEDGSKMSKSKGNYTDPMANLDVYGADALRYYLMTSVVMQAEDLRFSDSDLREAHNRVVNMLWNVHRFYMTYAEGTNTSVEQPQSEHVLDMWIVARLKELTIEVTNSLENYTTAHAGRSIRPFVEDLSQWYVRRSRDRFKSEEKGERTAAIETTRYVLSELSRLVAPFMPFIAERIYLDVDANQMSVHLTEWPEHESLDDSDKKAIEDMLVVRDIVSKGLEARVSAGIKVRQPLSRLSIKDELAEDLLALISDEVNVETVEVSHAQPDSVVLDTTMTPALAEKGMLREFLRSAQGRRKERGRKQGELATLIVESDGDGEDFIKKYEDVIKKTGSFEAILFQEVSEGKGFDSHGTHFKIET